MVLICDRCYRHQLALTFKVPHSFLLNIVQQGAIKNEKFPPNADQPRADKFQFKNTKERFLVTLGMTDEKKSDQWGKVRLPREVRLWERRESQ